MATKIFPIYSTNSDDSSRFYLGTIGNNPLIVCGINPSTATNEKSDPTITKVTQYTKIFGYDSFIMINVYPERSTEPGNLSKEFDKSLHNKNITKISLLLQELKKRDLLVCWGNNIKMRPFLLNCSKELLQGIKSNISGIYQLGELTDRGHPKHPGRTSYDLKLQKFDVDNYFNNN